ncbi:MAG: methyltransferase domain-containing protein [Pseudomonadales bacterium]|nr:methyltransferase domain-containing protein [Pseudomonadales bacterium]
MKKMAQWFESNLGTQVFNAQQAIMDQLLPGYFGYHLCQLSVQPRSLFDSSPIHHKFVMRQPELAVNTTDPQGFISDAENLPFENDSIDVLLLHHLLDFSPAPQQLLREIARISLPMGHVVIVGFNPFSLWGAVKAVGGRRNKSPWNGNFIRPGRLMDWLNLLNFKIDRAQYCIYGLPLNSAGVNLSAGYPQGLSRDANWPFGAVYVIVARKQVGTMTPIKPAWKERSGFHELSVVRPVRPVSGRQISTPDRPGNK